jgi:transposase InsO family protein
MASYRDHICDEILSGCNFVVILDMAALSVRDQTISYSPVSWLIAPMAPANRSANPLHRTGSPWENCYCESFNCKFRDEVLAREIFYTLREAQGIIEQWRKEYNTFRPHSSLNYQPPAPEAILTT